MKKAIFSFGKMNPPHIGHCTIASIFKEQSGDHFLTLSKRQDENNPLPYDIKKELVEEVLGIKVWDKAHSVKPVIEYLKQEHYEHVILVCGSDREPMFQSIKNSINKDFKKVEVIISGIRNNENNSSSTKMIQHVRNNNYSAFEKMLPSHVDKNRMFKTIWNFTKNTV